jgi:hypothetical protein
MTVDPALKVAMDRYDRQKVTAIFVLAALNRTEKVLPPEIASASALDQDALDKLVPTIPVPEGVQALVVSLQEFTEIKAAGMLLVLADSEDAARRMKSAIEQAADLAKSLLKINWEMDVKVSAVSGPAAPGRAGFPVLTATPAPGAAPGAPGSGGTDANRDGSLTIASERRSVLLAVDLNISHQLYEHMRDGLKAEMIMLKGLSELVATRPRVHELARALQAYVKAKGSFPRGALPRPPSSERGIDWYPNQRLSWMTELLPYVGDGDFKDLAVDPDKSWNEGSNFLTARVLVPQFLSPGDAKNARVRFPGRIGLFAATRFVGVAGVGQDAATYPAGDAARAKLLGVFGYDRVTKPDDIKDEPDNTIALLQIPSGQITPWMAGGGSTLRGVSEGDDALRPFVCAEYKGKKGTFAVMADGKVRFIAEDMKPATFRALCTIAGGERIDDIDGVAPVVPEEAPAAASKPAPVAAATSGTKAEAPATPPAGAPSAGAKPPASEPPATGSKGPPPSPGKNP